MVGGVDRYYQIARCFRDEDLRADRQFEFTQLDAEMSFASQDDVLAAITAAVAAVVSEVTGRASSAEIPRMTWRDAMDRYGSDKPDVRFGMELVELTDLFAETGFNAFKASVHQGHPPSGRRRRHHAGAAGRPHRPGQAVGRQGPGLDAGGGGDDGGDAQLAGRQVPLRRRAGGHRRALAAEPGDVLFLVADDWARTARTCWACCDSSSAGHR